MNFEEYISHVFKGKKPNSPFQYGTKHPQQYYEGNREALDQELRDHFASWLYMNEVKKSQRMAFLDYHMGAYEGDPLDFWDFVQHSPAKPFDPDMDDYMRLLMQSAPETGAKVEWLQLRRDFAYRRLRVFRQDDPRIKGRLDNAHIRQYFIGSFLPEKGEPIMPREDVEYFLRANFAGFEPREEPRLLETKGAQISITRIVRMFFDEHSIKTTEAQVYCQMLKDNFSVYGETTMKSLKSNFAKCVAKSYAKKTD